MLTIYGVQTKYSRAGVERAGEGSPMTHRPLPQSCLYVTLDSEASLHACLGPAVRSTLINSMAHVNLGLPFPGSPS